MPFGAGESDNPVVKAWLPDEGYLDSDKLGKVDETAQYMPSRPVHEDSEGHTPLHHLDIGTVK